jgi:hypothetical protein
VSPPSPSVLILGRYACPSVSSECHLKQLQVFDGSLRFASTSVGLWQRFRALVPLIAKTTTGAVSAPPRYERKMTFPEVSASSKTGDTFGEVENPLDLRSVKCLFTLCTIEHPILLSDGLAYDEDQIEIYFQHNGGRVGAVSPWTRQPLRSVEILPAHAVAQFLKQFKAIRSCLAGVLRLARRRGVSGTTGECHVAPDASSVRLVHLDPFCLGTRRSRRRQQRPLHLREASPISPMSCVWQSRRLCRPPRSP